MPEFDVTGKVAQRSLKVISRLREQMRDKVPYGPLRSYMTAKETRMALQDMDPVAKQQLMQRVGPEEWSRMMEDLYA